MIQPDEATYSDVENSKLTQKFCCNKCHSSLTSHPAPNRRWFVRCISCETNSGFVTRSTAGYREVRIWAEKKEMRAVMTLNALPFDDYEPAEKFDESAALTALGF